MGREIPEGLHVRYQHVREWKYSGNDAAILPRGGITYAYIEDEDNNCKVMGIAKCSKDDHYVKKVGRKIALERALYNLETRQELING